MTYNCLYIHPFVHVTIDKDEALFYNTLSFESYVVDDTEVLKILNNPATPQMNVFLVNDDNLSCKTLVFFIEKIRVMYMGDLINDVNPTCLPVQIPLKPKIHHNYSAESSRAELEEGYLLLDNLHQLTIYTNSIALDEVRFEDAHKQFLYFKSMDGELDVELLLKRLEEFRLDNLQIVNVIGNSEYGGFDKLVNSLNALSCNVIYNYNLDSITKSDLSVLENVNNKIDVNISFPCDVLKIKQLFEQINDTSKNNVSFSFIIESTDDLEYAQRIISDFSIDQYSFKPYLTQSNIDFFRDNVFVSQSDILSAEHSFKDILINQSVNINFFGKLEVFENGDVYSNINKDRLGNLKTHSIAALIKQEFQRGDSWLLNRDKREKCSNCIYRYVCPAPSNYELACDVDTICLKYNSYPSLALQENKLINQIF